MTEEEKLKAFIYDDNVQEQLREISNSLKTYNIFDIVGMGEQEIKHSNFLGWLFELKIDGHGYVFLEEFLRGCLNVLDDKNKCDNLQKYIYLKSKNKIKAHREWRNLEQSARPVDLIIEDEENQVLIVIENKINAGEDIKSDGNNGQLSDYETSVKEYGKWKKWILEGKKDKKINEIFYFFLSPDGTLASEKNQDTWKAIDYGVVAKPLEKILKNIKNDKISINSDFALLIDHYLDLLYRKGIVMNDAVKQICNEIWKGHREALEILFENKQGLTDFKEDIKKCINEKLNMKDENWISYQKNANTDYYLYLPKWLDFYGINTAKMDAEDIKTKYIGLGIYFTKTYIQIWIQPLNNNERNKKVYESVKQKFDKNKIETKNTIALRNFEEKKYMFSHGDEKFGEINIEFLKKEIVETLEKINDCFVLETH